VVVTELSVVVNVDAWEWIREAVARLERQTIAGSIELVLVCPSAERLGLPPEPAPALAVGEASGYLAPDTERAETRMLPYEVHKIVFMAPRRLRNAARAAAVTSGGEARP
jgi:hypothetical protein